MDKKQIGLFILTKISMSEEAITPEENMDIWISPAHWKAMDAEKKAVVVDLWHRENNYDNEFLLVSMISPKNSYDVGITFYAPGTTTGSDSDNKDIVRSSLYITLKELKIPHLKSTHSQISKKRDSFIGKEK